MRVSGANKDDPVYVISGLLTCQKIVFLWRGVQACVCGVHYPRCHHVWQHLTRLVSSIVGLCVSQCWSLWLTQGHGACCIKCPTHFTSHIIHRIVFVFVLVFVTYIFLHSLRFFAVTSHVSTPAAHSFVSSLQECGHLSRVVAAPSWSKYSLVCTHLWCVRTAVFVAVTCVVHRGGLC